MLVDEIVHWPSAQVKDAKDASTRIPIPGRSTASPPRTLKKPKAARAQYGPQCHPSPSTAPSFALPSAAVAPTGFMAPDTSDSPLHSPSSSTSSGKLLKPRQGSTVPLFNLSFPSPPATSPVTQAPALISSPVSPSIPPPIPRIQTSLSGLPSERARNATQFGSPSQPPPGSTLTRPLLSPPRPSGTPIVEIHSEANPPSLVLRYSKVKNKRWALWALYLLFGLGNLILAVRMRNTCIYWNPRENSKDTPTTQRAGLPLPHRELVDLWKIAPLINVWVTCGLLAIYWAVDKWYPVTFISRPLPEMFFYLVLFGIQIATTVDQALYVEPTIQWLIDEYHLGPQDRIELNAEARASSVFMSIQAFIILLAFGVVAYHVVYHIRHDGSKTSQFDVLKHPTCRYIPHAPPASAFFASPFDTTRFKNEISATSLPV